MARYHATVESRRSATETFGYLATFSNAAQRDPGLAQFLSGRPRDPGTTTSPGTPVPSGGAARPGDAP
jgi:hypothetical protein